MNTDTFDWNESTDEKRVTVDLGDTDLERDDVIEAIKSMTDDDTDEKEENDGDGEPRRFDRGHGTEVGE